MEPVAKGRDYSTSEKRIAHVASAWNFQYGTSSVNWKALGFSDEEIAEGGKLGLALCEERAANYRIHGDPAYGSWGDYVEVEQPVRDKVNSMIEGAE